MHLAIWEARTWLWPDELPDPLNMLTPEAAAKVLGLEYASLPSLGNFGRGGRDKFAVAGTLDRARNLIAVSERFGSEVMRFTGAHEVGHYQMHKGMQMHRDRPISGVSADTTPRPLEEREADYFAACFLMPEKLIHKSFMTRFGPRVPFPFDERRAFQLSPRGYTELIYADQNSHARALSLASAQSFNGAHFRSLADSFRVSPLSMAIRLEELGLLER